MFRPHGGFAELTVQNSETVIPHPQVSPSIAAATPCAGWTAWRALYDKLNISQHQHIFIAGGSGGVGGFALQIARDCRLETIITTCSAKNHDYARQLGATHVIDYRDEDVVARVREITGNVGVPIGFDTVGPDNDRLVANALAFEGQMVALVSTVRPEAYDDAFMKGLSFHQLSLGAGHRHGDAAKAALCRAGQAFSRLLEQQRITVSKLQTIDLDSVGEALTDIRQQRTVGKIVLKI